MSTTAVGNLGGVASPETLASHIGVSVLAMGGNAIDAAVAIGFALAVTFPSAGNIGGGGFLLYRHPSGRNVAIDFRETAPAMATSDMYLSEDGKVISGDGGPVDGYRACGVPGSVAGFELAWMRYGSGRIPWSKLVDPAVQLASGGFSMPHSLQRSLSLSMDRISSDRSFQTIFLSKSIVGWQPQRTGTTIRQPRLGETLARIRDRGAIDFYAGTTARLLASDIQRNGGMLLSTDLAGYQAVRRKPLSGRFMDFQVLTMPPPSSGGIALLQMLGMLEMCHPIPAAYSPAYIHLVTQSMRRAFRDRSEYLGDADFVDVPVDALLSRRHIAKLNQGLSVAMKVKTDDLPSSRPVMGESEQTTHFTVIDRDGGVVSTTYTLNGSYGAAVISENTGIILNNEMDDFTAKVGVPNQFGLIQSAKNAISPKKRPLSSMTPTIVADASGQIRIATGSPGGPTIINSVLHTVLQAAYFGVSVHDAVAAPRFHHQWKPEVLQLERSLSSARASLSAMGYETAVRSLGDVHAGSWNRTGGVTMSSDPRGTGEALAE
jgi:gamma-glutamyltranspeptidase/glutathione hydrolase